MSVLVVVDHASNHVPADIDLRIDPALLQTHIAWDVGAAALAAALGYPRHLATVSRLVIDVNREEDAPGLIPVESDGIVIPGNPGDRVDRLRRFHRPYHEELTQRMLGDQPALLVSLHSFTPQLTSRPAETRPWEVGVLYNDDDRAPRIALPLLAAAGIVTGDQLPYSGKQLNYTMNRHAEGTRTPYLGLEVRQDLIADEQGVSVWAAKLRPIVDRVLDVLLQSANTRRHDERF